VNSVPDKASLEVDVRTVPGVDHAALLERLKGELGAAISLEKFVDVPPLISKDSDPWVRRVFACCAPYHAEPIVPKVVPYFTDGAVLVPRTGSLPALILGPGEIHMMHKTDEYCRVERVHEAVRIYSDILADWAEHCGASAPKREQMTF
jgi:succinyl-diaminopimelate desuccinylase